MQIISMLSKPEWLHFEFCTTLFFHEKGRTLKSLASSKEIRTSSLPQGLDPAGQVVNICFFNFVNRFFFRRSVTKHYSSHIKRAFNIAATRAVKQ